LVRAVPVLAVLAVALAACKGQPPKSEHAAASGTPPASSAPPVQTPPPAQHNWAYRQGDDYAYLSGTTPVGQPEQATLVRYLGEENGVYTIVETQAGAVVGASCSKPCDTVRLRGKGLDQTLALNPSSIVYAALSDAMAGQLEIYKVKGPIGAAPTAPPK